MSLTSALLRLAGALTLAVAVAGCDHGGAFIVDNKTDQQFIARVSGYEYLSGSVIGSRLRQDLLTMPARSRLAVAVLGFKDPFNVQKIEILMPDCAVVATFSVTGTPALGSGGQVIVIEQGPAATLRDEFPLDGTRAGSTDRCRDTVAE